MDRRDFARTSSSQAGRDEGSTQSPTRQQRTETREPTHREKHGDSGRLGNTGADRFNRRFHDFAKVLR